MHREPQSNRHTTEIALLIVTLALGVLLYRVAGFKIVVLNLFYLPVVLAAFFLGRYHAGVLAFLTVVLAAGVAATDLVGFAVAQTPLAVGLALTVWGAIIGLTALLVGTLSDDRNRQLTDLREAYFGMADVVSRYLNSADPASSDRAHRVASLCASLARRMRLPERLVEDVRVAALLQDLENVEITARVIRRALGDIETHSAEFSEKTFHGSEFVRSLGEVVHGALPMLNRNPQANEQALESGLAQSVDILFGGQIVCVARAYDDLIHKDYYGQPLTPDEALDELRSDQSLGCHPRVLEALQQVVTGKSTAAVPSAN